MCDHNFVQATPIQSEKIMAVLNKMHLEEDASEPPSHSMPLHWCDPDMQVVKAAIPVGECRSVGRKNKAGWAAFPDLAGFDSPSPEPRHSPEPRCYKTPLSPYPLYMRNLLSPSESPEQERVPSESPEQKRLQSESPEQERVHSESPEQERVDSPSPTAKPSPSPEDNELSAYLAKPLGKAELSRVSKANYKKLKKLKKKSTKGKGRGRGKGKGKGVCKGKGKGVATGGDETPAKKKIGEADKDVVKSGEKECLLFFDFKYLKEKTQLNI